MYFYHVYEVKGGERRLVMASRWECDALIAAEELARSRTPNGRPDRSRALGRFYYNSADYVEVVEDRKAISEELARRHNRFMERYPEQAEKNNLKRVPDGLTFRADEKGNLKEIR